jgi:hypothetical protein
MKNAEKDKKTRPLFEVEETTLRNQSLLGEYIYKEKMPIFDSVKAFKRLDEKIQNFIVQ